MEILERQVPAVIHLFEFVDHRRPVCRTVQQRTERMQVEFLCPLVPFLEVDILDPLTQDRDPVFGKLVVHDVASIEVDLDMFALKAVDEFDHLLRAKQESVSKDVLDIDVYTPAFSAAGRIVRTASRARRSQTSLGTGIEILDPGRIHCTWDDEQILGLQQLGCRDHFLRQFNSLFTSLRDRCASSSTAKTGTSKRH